MGVVAVLDWGFISKSIWLSLPAKSTPWTRRTEIEEGSHRVCEWIYGLYKEHQWDRCIIAQDSGPYWRHELMESFYNQSPIYKVDDAYYTFFDGSYHHIDQTLGTFTKQKADMNKKLDKLEDKVALTLDERSALPKLLWPRYKGNRKNKPWPCETSPEDFYKIQSGLAARIAPLIKGITVAIPTAEADDIAAVVTAIGQKHKLILCSGDADWKQIFRTHTNSVWHDLFHNKRVHCSPEEIQAVRDGMLLKIIGGEPGDGIKGCPRLDRAGWSCLAEAGAKKLIDARDFSQVCRSTMARNRKLIEMTKENIPADLYSAISADVLRIRQPIPAVSWGWTDLGLTTREIERLDMESTSNRVFDAWFNRPEEKLTAMLDNMAETQEVANVPE